MTQQTEQRTPLSVVDGRVCPRPDDREKRRFTRHPCDRWVGLVTIDGDGARSSAITAKAEDISIGGLGLYAWEELSGRGAVLIPRSDGEPEVVGAEIAYCRPRSRHDFDCGLRFTGPTDVGIEDFRDENGRAIDLGVVRPDPAASSVPEGA